jgi:hypothetical protein
MSDTRFEQDLRLVLSDMAPADVPAALRASVAAVPRTQPWRSSPRLWLGRPRLAALGALAAVIVVAAVGVALLLGGRLGGNVAGPSAPPSVAPTPAVTSWTTLTYAVGARPIPAASPLPGAAANRTPLAVATARLEAARIPYSAQATADGFSVTVPTDQSAAAADLVGATGEVAFVPMGSQPVQAGATLDLSAHPPLFGSDGIASASAGVDQTGNATVDIVLSPTARDEFATYPAAHIGDYLAITIDGQVLADPVIQSSIPNGEVQVTAAGVGGFGPAEQANLVAVLSSGPMPGPLTQTGAEPASAPANPWTPGPTPSPSPSPSPFATGSPAPNLDVEPLAGAPANISGVVRWSGGYLAVAAPPSPGLGIWSSPDGRTWTEQVSAKTMFGTSPVGMVDGLAPCGSGAVLVYEQQDGTIEGGWSKDGVSWHLGTLPASLVGTDGVRSVAGGRAGALATTGDGRLLISTDCQTWSRVSLPGASGSRATVAGAALLGNRFVAVGYTDKAAAIAPPGGQLAAFRYADLRPLTTMPLAWWSDDGSTWHQGLVPDATPSTGFGTIDGVSGEALVAWMTTPGYTPGVTSLWRSTDGKAWESISGPLGMQAGGEGGGSAAGFIESDGTRILAWGSPGDGAMPTSGQPAGGLQYWLTLDGHMWRELTPSGGAASNVVSPDATFSPFLLADGLLFSSQTTTLVGSAPLDSLLPAP